MKSCLSGPKTWFTLDLRALAAFRIGIGFLLATDTLMRWQDIRAHYTDFGVLPVGPYVEEFAIKLYISLHLANGTLGWQIFLFSITLCAALSVMIGYRTRLATIIAWVLLVSVQNRNPMVLNAGDFLFRLLYFWSLFLPLNSRYSVDAVLSSSSESRDENIYFSASTVAYVLQIAMVYAFTAILKSGNEWWPDGTASFYALNLSELTTAFGVWMVQWYDLLHITTYFVYFFEGAVAFLILCPIYHVQVKLLTLVALVIMHLNFDLAMRLGIFPWVDIVALIPLLPTPVCNWLATRVKNPIRLKSTLLIRQFLQASQKGTRSFSTTKFKPVITLSLIFLIGYVGFWNFKTISKSGMTSYYSIGRIFRLDQKWNMFAPYPRKAGGWYVIDGTLVDGTKVDVLQKKMEPANYEKPPLVSDIFPNARWRKYMMNIYQKNKREHRLYYGKYLCRSWNEKRKDPQKLATFELIFMKTRTVLPGEEAAAVEKVTLWSHTCIGKKKIEDKDDDEEDEL